MSQPYSIRSGDSLTSIAERFRVPIEDLIKANGITDPDRIFAGDVLRIPDEFRAENPRSTPDANDQYDPNWWRTPTPLPETVTDERRVDAPAGPVRAANGRTFATSRDGTPLYRQNDPEWNARSPSAGAATSTAMALSRISGQPITPGELDRFLDTHHGYSGGAMRWDVAAASRGLGAERQPWNLDTVNSQIDAGRPVVIGIDSAPGSRAGRDGTDQWATLTRRERDAQGVSTYFANDPATGREIRLREQSGRLVGENNYRSSGQLVTFSGGNTRQPAQTPAPRPTPGPIVTPVERPARQDPATPPLEAPVGLRSRRAGTGLDLQRELTSPDSTLSVAIGNAEGTRTRDGGHTRFYGSHTDPGNQRRNLGTFSYQAHQNPNVRTPEQADQVQLRRLRGQIPAYEAAVQRAGLDPNNPRLQAAYFDLWNQSPNMAGRFLNRMSRTLGGREISAANIAAARNDAMYDDRGRFTARGLRTPERAQRDQLRRTEAIEAVLRARGAV